MIAWIKVLAASLRVGFCDEWKKAFKLHNCTNNCTINKCTRYLNLCLKLQTKGIPKLMLDDRVAVAQGLEFRVCSALISEAYELSVGFTKVKTALQSYI